MDHGRMVERPCAALADRVLRNRVVAMYNDVPPTNLILERGETWQETGG